MTTSVNSKFESQFSGLVKEIWTFLENCPSDVEGHFANLIPSHGLFDQIELHIVEDRVGVVAIDSLNSIKQIAVLSP